ncbi:VPS10 domain-containing protein [Zobellia galactanivorans]|uniref:BNR repeats protein n=1 Tax=Zobellia galactanivorans (strain DSM 12802 / CCUG 47099 / CIP 106680 / NCIMB 13871 / Dsij) TaxID=63186 RepID=G0L071_ZOBGA|nr:oxidoreductase [Zobellia galactanivorans]MBU3027190.1 oxidoreductase [Zobellia galactanivorans]CAZ94163.1 BNR repeats protein [Zobellia galactanivorans]
MRTLFPFLLVVLLVSCSEKRKAPSFTSVAVQTVYEDSVSIRAIELMGNSLGYAGNNGVFGSIDLATGKVMESVQEYRDSLPEFRSIAHTSSDFFMLSIANPALLYKTGDKGRMQLVYKEEDENVFYDAMSFWNDKEGIAIGDSMNGCLSILITRDGGNTWEKIPCSELPEGVEGEGAFAASNTNIKVLGDKAWVATTKSRIYFSADKGKTWQIQKTPISSEAPTQGIFSVDFYNEKLGMAIGGDFTRPEINKANKAITEDGGKTWQLIADGQNPQYKSCVQFVPGSEGNGLVAIGFTGISYSNDRGLTWKSLSDEPFYTLRFFDSNTAYAAGKHRIAKLVFK